MIKNIIICIKHTLDRRFILFIMILQIITITNSHLIKYQINMKKKHEQELKLLSLEYENECIEVLKNTSKEAIIQKLNAYNINIITCHPNIIIDK